MITTNANNLLEALVNYSSAAHNALETIERNGYRLTKTNKRGLTVYELLDEVDQIVWEVMNTSDPSAYFKALHWTARYYVLQVNNLIHPYDFQSREEYDEAMGNALGAIGEAERNAAYAIR